MKKIYLTLAAAGLVLQTMGQSPWVKPAGSPVYTRLDQADKRPFIISPTPNVVWGLGSESIHGNMVRTYDTKVFRTTDDGTTWQTGAPTSYTAGYAPEYYITGNYNLDLSAVNDQTAWILQNTYTTTATSTQILRTTSGPGGFVSLGAAPPVSMLHFFTATTGVAFSNYIPAGSTSLAMYRTTDGGVTWTPVSNPPTFAGATEAFYIKTKQGIGNTLWLSSATYSSSSEQSNAGVMLRTPDAGLTWTTTPNVGKMAFEDAQNGLSFYYTGSGTNSSVSVRRTTDGGLTWTPVNYTGTFGPAAFTAVANMPGTYLSYSAGFVSASTNLAKGTISVSYDRGNSWQVLESNFTTGKFEQLLAPSPRQFWAAVNIGDYFSPNQPMIMRYGGTTLPTKRPQTATNLSAYPNPTTGLVQLAGSVAAGTVVRVYDAAGRLCQQTMVSGVQPSLNLQQQPAGLYQLLFTAPDGQVQSVRVSKE